MIQCQLVKWEVYSFWHKLCWNKTLLVSTLLLPTCPSSLFLYYLQKQANPIKQHFKKMTIFFFRGLLMFSLALGSLLNSQKKKKAYSTTIVKTHQAQKPCWSQNQSHSTADQKQPWCWLFSTRSVCRSLLSAFYGPISSWSFSRAFCTLRHPKIWCRSWFKKREPAEPRASSSVVWADSRR